MDEHKRTEAAVQHAVNARLSGLQENPWMARRVLTAIKGEEKVKKKISVGLLFVIIAIFCTGVAIAANTNLFEYFAKINGGDYLNKANQAAKFYDAQTITIPQDGHFSEAAFSVDQSYYDGQTLIIAYTLSKKWIPSQFLTEDEALAAHGDWVSEAYLDMPKPRLDDILSPEDVSLFEQKRKQDGAVQLACFTQSVDDYVMLGETAIDASGANIVRMPDGTTMGYIIFTSPLPKEAQDQEALSLAFVFNRHSFALYEDESGFYDKHISGSSTQIPLTIRRNASPAEKLTGFVELGDGCITALATLSDIELKADITISASAETIQAILAQIPSGGQAYALYAGSEKCASPSGGEQYAGETSITISMSMPLPEDTNNLTLVPTYTTAETASAYTIALTRGN